MGGRHARTSTGQPGRDSGSMEGMRILFGGKVIGDDAHIESHPPSPFVRSRPQSRPRQTRRPPPPTPPCPPASPRSPSRRHAHSQLPRARPPNPPPHKYFDAHRRPGRRGRPSRRRPRRPRPPTSPPTSPPRPRARRRPTRRRARRRLPRPAARSRPRRSLTPAIRPPRRTRRRRLPHQRTKRGTPRASSTATMARRARSPLYVHLPPGPEFTSLSPLSRSPRSLPAPPTLCHAMPCSSTRSVMCRVVPSLSVPPYAPHTLCSIASLAVVVERLTPSLHRAGGRAVGLRRHLRCPGQQGASLPGGPAEFSGRWT